MRNFTKKSVIFILLSFLIGDSYILAQNPLQYWRPASQDGVRVFEDPKEDTLEYDGFRVRVGGDFALQFQAIDHSTGSNSDTLVDLGSNFNLPSANLNLDVQLTDGVRMHLRTFLSSRHHTEAWVKGGHVQIDKLDFISPGFLSGVMNMARIRIGLDEINYGDAHFRRTDNARALYNPFSGNYIMDAFSTEAFGEIYVLKSGFIGMIGISNGKLNQSVVKSPGSENKISFYGKLGYDHQFTPDFRLRLTGSLYTNTADSRKYIYGGDRSGSRYYHVMETLDGGSDFSGRFNPGFNQLTAIQFNPFVKFMGLEVFGIVEIAIGGEEDGNGSFTQLASEVIYRIGQKEKIFAGGRYNLVNGKFTEDTDDVSINRLNIGGGWFLTKNVVAKLEYVSQNYSGDGWIGSVYEDGSFNGLMLEAAISF